jgi:hypothetical protein
MPAKTTFTLPEPGADTTDTTGQRLAEWRHAVWVEIAEGMLQRCPDPENFRVHPDASIASLDLCRGEHVAVWAAFLGLPAPSVRAHDVPVRDGVKGAYRLTTTSTHGDLDGVWWNLTHYHRDPIDPVTDTTDAGPAAGGEGE